MTATNREDPAVTPSQTIGPFFHDALAWASAPVAPAPGAVRVEGAVLDGNGQPVDDALIEVWQPGSGGSAPAEFQRIATDRAGRFAFTVRPSAGVPEAAHVTVFARGLLNLLRTRVYAGATVDQLRQIDGLRDVPAAALETLIALGQEDVYRWDVRLQGDGETLFFELLPRTP